MSPRGRLQHSHLLGGACKQELHDALEAAGFTSIFPGLPKPGPKKERGSRIPCHIPGPSTAGLSDLSALYVFWDMNKESGMECAGYSRTIIYSPNIYYVPGLYYFILPHGYTHTYTISFCPMGTLSQDMIYVPGQTDQDSAIKNS